MTPHDELLLESAALAPGTRTKILCPKCRGGQSKEITLSLYKHEEGGIAWVCFRASCGYKGNPRGVAGESVGAVRPLPKYFTYPYTELQDAWGLKDPARVLMKRLGFLPPRCSWCPELSRYVLKIVGPGGALRGHQAYSLVPGAQKAITYREVVDEPFMHWTPDNSSNRVVIVEDWFSAEKVAAAGGRACALLGTHLNPERVEELARSAQNATVCLALDADAYAKSVRYSLDYGTAFYQPLRVWRLAVDLKYENLETIREALNDRITDFRSYAGTTERV